MRAASCKPVDGLLPFQRSVRWAILSLRARRATAAASRLDSLRRPWSTVTATNFGFVLSASRQRAANTISAVESGPPDTASTRTGKACRPEKSAFASDGEMAADFCAGMIVTKSRLQHSDQGRGRLI